MYMCSYEVPVFNRILCYHCRVLYWMHKAYYCIQPMKYAGNINAELMIMASHQTFSGQVWNLTDQTKFDQTIYCTLSMGK